ncbi:hypothetical protein HMPREF1550_02689, partial [Actinomyces sp. oral taxon 877 str. F0543]
SPRRVRAGAPVARSAHPRRVRARTPRPRTMVRAPSPARE